MNEPKDKIRRGESWDLIFKIFYIADSVCWITPFHPQDSHWGIRIWRLQLTKKLNRRFKNLRIRIRLKS